jgi:hypothetical protein
MRTMIFVAQLFLLVLSSPAWAHQVWAHNTCKDPVDTVEFFHKSKEIYVALTRLEKIWQEASYSLENGILAEFDSKIDKAKSLRIDDYRKALTGYMELRSAMNDLDKAIQVLQGVDTKCEKVEIFVETLKRNLTESAAFPRLSTAGVRFADAAGLPREQISQMYSIADILQAWKNDLGVMEKTLDEVIAAMKDAMPLAERGEFAAVMLSGRNAFGEKMPQFTNMFSAYQRLYVTTVLATITTTMQVYPKGFEWLTSK